MLQDYDDAAKKNRASSIHNKFANSKISNTSKQSATREPVNSSLIDHQYIGVGPS